MLSSSPLNSCQSDHPGKNSSRASTQHLQLQGVALSKKWLVRDRVCVLGGPWWSMVHSNGPCFRRTVLVHGPVHGPCFRGTLLVATWRLRSTCHYLAPTVYLSLLGTYSLLVTTWHLQSTCRYLAPTVYLSLLGTYSLLVATWHLSLLGTYSLLVATWHLQSTCRYLAPTVYLSLLGTYSLLVATWHLSLLGTYSLLVATWHSLHGCTVFTAACTIAAPTSRLHRLHDCKSPAFTVHDGRSFDRAKAEGELIRSEPWSTNNKQYRNDFWSKHP